MAMNNFSTRLLVLLAASAAATAFAACGDDAKPKGGPADAKLQGSADAAVDANTTPDATPPDAMPTATVAGTIAMSDVKLLDPSTAALGGVSGGSILISF